MRVLESLFDLKFTHRQFIEASAGTGKTYTIAGLFVRLLLEKRLRVDQILVMTFTKKATAELRDRIFARLRESLWILQGGRASDKAWMEQLLHHVPNEKRQDLTGHLEEAIRNFDESQIYTIHGFCQKILREEALMAGTPFDLEVTGEDSLLLQAAEDEWRLFMASHPKDEAGLYRLKILMEVAENPADLIRELKPLFSRPYAEIRGEGHPDPETYLKKVISGRRELKYLWEKEMVAIRRELIKSDLSGYTDSKVTLWINQMNEALSKELYEPMAFNNIFRFFASTHRDPANLKKNGEKIPEHPFFVLCEQYHTLLGEMERVKRGLVHHLFKAIRERRKRLAEVSPLVTYEDLLNRVAEALSDPEEGEALASQIRKKLPFALVDEFQDTDPVQYQIFDRIYPRPTVRSQVAGTDPAGGMVEERETEVDEGLLMIGDPKQAIYAFRGADIYTYLRARNHCGEEGWSLQKNYRSSPGLVKTVNRLFEGDHVPFLEDQIQFNHSAAALPELEGAFQVEGKPVTPLQISLKEGFFHKNQGSQAHDFAQQETVRQIVRLLTLSTEGKAMIKGNPLKAADLCVLVSSHREASQIKRALKRAGVGSVTYSRQKVFSTFEAERLLQLMETLLDPENLRNVSGLLLTGFFGRSLSQIEQLKRDESAFQELVEELQELHQIWHRSGFYPMFRTLLYRKGRLVEIADQEQSERMLTNLLQLAGICSRAEAEGKLSPGSLTRWFRRQIANPDEDDEKTLLLESDLNLVKISTIHNSKGLQFPVVFLPAPWSGLSHSTSKRLLSVYRDSETDQTVVHVGQDEDEESEQARQRTRFEAVSEEVRKFYVAVTRAQFHCHLCWTTHAYSHHSGLGATLLGSGMVETLVRKKITSLKASDNNEEMNDLLKELMNNRIIELSAQYPDLIGLDLYPEQSDEGEEDQEEIRLPEPVVPPLEPRSYLGRDELPLRRRVESFSSLVHRHDPGTPDHDQLVQEFSDQLQDPPEETKAPDIFSFPRGAVAGSAIHHLFEHENFDFRRAGREEDEGWIADLLEEYRIERTWAPVIRKILADVTGAEIPQLRLNEVAPSDLLREMEFHFVSNRLTAEELFALIRGQRGAQPGRSTSDQGMMTGFIDLIVRQNGKFYIIDYKSNHLGDSLSDYEAPALEREVVKAGYDLQAHLYLVALVKYLQKRLPGFRYETHIGGLLYLFVRGMREGSGNGVWFHRPEEKLIRELGKRLLRGEG